MAIPGLNDQVLNRSGPTANAAITITLAADPGFQWVVDHVAAGFDDRIITKVLTIESPSGTVKWDYPIHGADSVAPGLAFGSGAAVLIKLPASGVAAKNGMVSVAAHKISAV